MTTITKHGGLPKLAAQVQADLERLFPMFLWSHELDEAEPIAWVKCYGTVGSRRLLSIRTCGIGNSEVPAATLAEQIGALCVESWIQAWRRVG